jgi:palmitoyl transferase
MKWPLCVLSRSDRREPEARPEPPVVAGRALLLALILSITVAPATAQDAEPSATRRALSAANESSPFGLVPPAERHPGWKGWFADAWEGSKRIFQDGQSGLLLPFFTYHPPYKYPNHLQENPYPWGAGFARTVIDSSDNERMVFLLAFSDSHYDVQPMLGYAWIARWPLVAGLKGGLGYAAFLTARADANYFPLPAALPLASIGTDRVALYGTWVPTADVLFFFARISLPFADGSAAYGGSAAAATPSGAVAAWSGPPRRNLVYGAAAWVNTDASGIDSVASGNSWAPLVGYRHFLSERAAVDVSVSRSSHSLDLNGARLGTFDLMPVTVAAQYHFPSYHGLRMYAGAGVGFNRIPQQDLPGYSLSNSSISPVLQAGASYPLTNALVLTAGLAANFARFQLTEGETTLGTVKPSPVSFSLGLGYAF